MANVKVELSLKETDKVQNVLNNTAYQNLVRAIKEI